MRVHDPAVDAERAHRRGGVLSAVPGKGLLREMNVIVVVSDTFRYDYCGWNGNAWIRTPDLDRFAAGAVAFDRHYVSSFPTIPTRTDWFTARFSFPNHGWRALDPQVPVLAAALSRAGYLGQLIMDNPHMMKGTNNFDRGFEGACWLRGQEGDTYLTRVNRLHRTMPADKTRQKPQRHGYNLVDIHRTTNIDWAWEEDRFAARTLRTASRWLEENYKAERFFLWVDCFDVHEPWDPPEYWVERYNPGYVGPPMLHPNYGPAEIYSPAELANLRAHYAGEVSMISRWFGRLLQKLEDVGLDDRTAVVFTSDHGMFLGEHNRTGKSNLWPGDARRWPLYEEVAHIPLFMRVPGLAPRRVPALVQPPDLMPTLLDLAGVSAPPGVHGRSLLPLMRGEVQTHRTVAVSGAHGAQGAQVAVRDGRLSYYPEGEAGTPELYDTAADPAEARNLALSSPEDVGRLHSELTRWMAEHGAAGPSLPAGADWR